MNKRCSTAGPRSRTSIHDFTAFHKKSFVPGYAAHVPKIHHLFGISSGKMEKILKQRNGVKTFL